MLFVIVMVVTLLVAIVFTVWPTPAKPGTSIASAAGPVEPASTEPTTLEGTLATQVIHGEISSRQYVHALEGLASRENERDPLSVPQCGGPDECG
ncbi:hypothetical protein [Actinoplanes sp. NPDC026670]|uniref:hypothetical protein n=1 Tax=Actinoplanes sp. NPDC026670 TaxID=3154700 RepID=UPI0033D73748